MLRCFTKILFLLMLLCIVNKVKRSLRLFAIWMMMLRCFTGCLQNDWCCLRCLQSEKVDEIVRCDLSFAKELLRCLLTIDNLLWWCCYALLNGVSTSCLNVVNMLLKWNKHWKLLLKNISADVYHLQKMFNCLFTLLIIS